MQENEKAEYLSRKVTGFDLCTLSFNFMGQVSRRRRIGDLLTGGVRKFPKKSTESGLT